MEFLQLHGWRRRLCRSDRHGDRSHFQWVFKSSNKRGLLDESFGCMHAGDVEMYLKFWQTPGRDSKQYDRRSNPGDFRHPGSHRADLSSSVSLDKSCDCEYMLYRPGTWFLGVFVSGHEPASFDVRLAKSRCPNDCGGSGRGTCDAESGACTCAKVSNNEQLTA